MKWAFASSRDFQAFHALLLLLSTLALEIFGPDIRNVISVRIVLVTFIPRKRAAKCPLVPSHRTPAIPDGRFNVIRIAIPLSDEDTLVYRLLLGEGFDAHEVRPR